MSAPHQFEHDGFNSPNEVAEAQRKAPRTTVDLQTRLDEIDSLRLQAQMLATRCIGLHQSKPLASGEVVEYTALRNLFTDLQALSDRVMDGGW